MHPGSQVGSLIGLSPKKSDCLYHRMLHLVRLLSMEPNPDKIPFVQSTNLGFQAKMDRVKPRGRVLAMIHRHLSLTLPRPNRHLPRRQMARLRSVEANLRRNDPSRMNGNCKRHSHNRLNLYRVRLLTTRKPDLRLAESRNPQPNPHLF